VDPVEGRIWTANAPVVDGAMLALIGDGGYADGIRARIIRDRLRAVPRATSADMLDIQLDDQALFLERWRSLALDTIATAGDNDVGAHAAARGRFRHLVETTWTGHASPDSVAYRLVRTFRTTVVRIVMTFLTAPARAADASFDYTRSTRAEGPVWQLVTERPMHLLDRRFKNWHELLLSAVDETIDELTSDGQSLEASTWGQINRARIVHPLASALPLFGRWLNMPDTPLPGDVFTPRAHSPRTGPTERMIVSPGHEDQGILHMPTGQSAHPLSPHHADMHAAWVSGEAIPLLPGPPRNTLTLVP